LPSHQFSPNLAPTIGYDVAQFMINATYLLVIVLFVLNSGVLQGLTGQSIGKKVLGMQVVRGVIDPDGDKLIVRPGWAWGRGSSGPSRRRCVPVLHRVSRSAVDVAASDVCQHDRQHGSAQGARANQAHLCSKWFTAADALSQGG
jgi:hypothetical protein